MPIANKDKKEKTGLPENIEKILKDEVIPLLEDAHRKRGDTTKFAIFDGSKIDSTDWTTNEHLKIAKGLGGDAIVVMLMIQKEMKLEKKFSLHDQTNIMINVISEALNELTLIGLTDTVDFMSYSLSEKGEKVVEAMRKNHGFTDLIIPMAKAAYQEKFYKRLA